MRSNFSRISLSLCAAIIVATAFLYFPKWEMGGSERTISWDASGYYLYLPAVFIYDDLKNLDFFESIEQKYQPGLGGQVFRHQASGNAVLKYPAGQALQMLPWFTVGHLAAKTGGYPTDGFSAPYQAAISWGSILIAILGLWYARKVLKLYFTDAAVAIALLLTVWGSNYLNYSAIDGAMTHNWLFTLYSILIYQTILFYRKPSLGRAFFIGALCGWATLTRPTEIISILIPLLWGVGNWQALKQRLGFWKQHLAAFLVAGIGLALLVSIQLFYWKYSTGQWLVYSYEDQGFSWKHPHWETWLSYRAGWLVYSPVMVFAIAGLWQLWRRNRVIFWPVALFLALFSYIAAAWDIWWYGGSLGCRAMVQSYALWLFPLAAFSEAVVNTRRSWQILFCVLAGFFIWHNLFWTHQAHRGGLFVPEEMTNKYFWKVYGQTERENDWLKLLDNRDEFKLNSGKTGEIIWQNDFEQDTVSTTVSDPVAGERSLLVPGGENHSPAFQIPIAQDKSGFLRIHYSLRCAQPEYTHWKMLQSILEFSKDGKVVKSRMIKPQRLFDQQSDFEVFFTVKIPAVTFDKVQLHFWNPGSEIAIKVDNISVEYIP